MVRQFFDFNPEATKDGVIGDRLRRRIRRVIPSSWPQIDQTSVTSSDRSPTAGTHLHLVLGTRPERGTYFFAR